MRIYLVIRNKVKKKFFLKDAGFLITSYNVKLAILEREGDKFCEN